MNHSKKTTLSKQEVNWIKEQRITRLTDDKEVLIYPMGAERYLSSVLLGAKPSLFNIKAEIQNKNVLVIPGYGNSSFIFAEAGANSITVYDKDPVTIAWMKAFKKYYHYREYNSRDQLYPSVGELLTALTCWYPPLLTLPSGRLKQLLFWILYPKSLRRVYIYYMLKLVQQAIQTKVKEDFELDRNIEFYTGEIHHLIESKKKQKFDTAYVPYLLGVTNGIERAKDIVDFIKQLSTLVPKGTIFVTPSQNTKEFYVLGQSYFTTTEYATIDQIPGLKPYLKAVDKFWFKTQGIGLFGSPNETHPAQGDN